MRSLIFATGNESKYRIAQKVFASQKINLQQAKLDIDEIQAEEGEKIVRDKAAKAFAKLSRPVVVNDDSWSIPALGGFPGPYMKAVAQWFTAEDWLRLTSALKDMRIILTQYIAYQDAHGQKVITRKYTGNILAEIRGTYGNSLQKIITMPGDNGSSVAEVYDQGINEEEREVGAGWLEFIQWYQEHRQ